MARALSEDLRSRVLKASDEGMSARQAAARFGVGSIECDPLDCAGEDRRADRRDRRADAAPPASMRMKPSSSG